MSRAGASIDDLPDQVLGQVLALAGLEEGRAVCLVCKRWERVLYSEPALWRSFHLPAVPPALLPSQQQLWLSSKLQQLSRIASWVSSFVVEDWLSLQQAAVGTGSTQLASVFQMLQPGMLTQLRLSSSSLLPEALVKQVPLFTNLACLHISATTCPPSTTADVIHSLTQLTSLRYEALSLESAVADSILQLTALARLELMAGRVEAPSLLHLTALSQLSHLKLRQVGVGAASPPLELPLAASFPSLARIEIHAAQGVQVAGTKLRAYSFALALHPSDPDKQIGMLCIDRIAAMRSLHSLLAGLLPAGQPFSYLELEHCQMTPGALRDCHLLAELPALHLNCCTSEGSLSSALEPLLQQAAKLETLSITGSLGSARLPACLASKTGLKKLRLRQNRLEEMPAGPYMQSLELLDIGGENLSHGYLPSALLAATRLTQLVLDKSPKIRVRREDVDGILQEMPALRRLAVAPRALTALVAQRLKQSMPQLQVVHA